MQKINSQEILQELLQRNNQCFDCQLEIPLKFVSLNNGIFLCKECGQNHQQKLDLQISKIVEFDKKMDWTITELNYMILGGNQNLQKYFQSYNLPLDITIELKYKTKCSYYYRFQLYQKVHNEYKYKLETLQLGEALDVIDNEQFYQLLNNKADGNKMENDLVYTTFVNVGDGLKKIGLEVVQKGKQIYQDPKTQQYISETQETLNQGIQKVKQNQLVNDIGTKTTQGVTYLSEKSKQLYYVIHITLYNLALYFLCC